MLFCWKWTQADLAKWFYIIDTLYLLEMYRHSVRPVTESVPQMVHDSKLSTINHDLPWPWGPQSQIVCQIVIKYVTTAHGFAISLLTVDVVSIWRSLKCPALNWLDLDHLFSEWNNLCPMLDSATHTHRHPITAFSKGQHFHWRRGGFWFWNFVSRFLCYVGLTDTDLLGWGLLKLRSLIPP